MWQLVFVAAVAGSGILVKHLFRNGDERVIRVSEQKEDQSKTTVEVEEEKEKENVMEEVQGKQQQQQQQQQQQALINIVSSSSCIGDSWMSEKLMHSVEDEGSSSSIFRFTSSSLNGGGGEEEEEEEGSGSRSGNVNSVKRRSSTSSSSRSGEKKLMLEDQKKKKKKKNKERRRNVSFCLKRRRTAKIAFRRNSGSCSQSKGNSLFSCGVGFGFMLSARKAEFNNLTADIVETTQVISNLQDSSCKDRVANMETMAMNKKEPLLMMMTDFSVKLASPNDPQVLDLSSNGDGECPSSILTEEVDLEALEMDRLEAELESELQKIPNEEADPDYFMDFPNTKLSAYELEGPQEPHGIMDPNSSQFNGVSPTDLDRKLCHVLIKQQESQIAELESNLYLSQMKLREKDAELGKLKAVVCSLRDFSLQTASDDEAENGVILDEVEKEMNSNADSLIYPRSDDEAENGVILDEVEKEMNSNADSLIYPRSDDDGSNKIIVVQEQKSLCGVKRSMEFESYANCQVNHNTLVS